MFGATLLFLMGCFKSGQHWLRHNDLCKTDTNQSDLTDNSFDHRQHRRVSDLGSVASNVSHNVVKNVPLNGVNGVIDELAHLQCTCDHINDKLFGLADGDANHDEGAEEKVGKDCAPDDDVAVLEEEDVVLDDEDIDKVEDEEDDDEDDDDYIGRVDDYDDDERVDGRGIAAVNLNKVKHGSFSGTSVFA